MEKISLADSSVTKLNSRASSSDGKLGSRAGVGETSSDSMMISFGNFDDWLAAFSRDEAPMYSSSSDINSVPARPLNPSFSPRITNGPKPDASASTIRVSVQGIHSRLSKSKTENFNIFPHDAVTLILQQLRLKGYKRICALRYQGRLISPFTSHIGPCKVRVVEESSCYSPTQGLKINVNETCKVFYENLGKHRNGNNNDNSGQVHVDDTSITIINTSLDESIGLNISFARTLRVPEDGKVYGAPQLFAPALLRRVEDYKSRVPLDMARKGGVFMPLHEREALAIGFRLTHTSEKTDNQFAVKCLMGVVNTISGSTITEDNQHPAQDHIVVPGQTRLDGSLCSSSLVKQFVASPQESGIAAEGQSMGIENYGGIQLLIASKHSGQGDFGGLRPDLTPAESGLQPGDYISVQGNEVEFMSRSIEGLPQIVKGTKDHSAIRMPQNCRPKLVKEMLQELRLEDVSMVVLDPVYPFSLLIIEQARDNYWKFPGLGPELEASSSNKRQRNAGTVEVSPFMSLNDFNGLLREHLHSEYIVFYEERKPVIVQSSSNATSQLHELISGSCCLVCQTYRMRKEPGYSQDTPSARVKELRNSYDPNNQYVDPNTYALHNEKPTSGYQDVAKANEQYFTTLRSPYRMSADLNYSVQTPADTPAVVKHWNTTLAGGGYINQAIARDAERGQWNWEAAHFVNIQFVNAITYERITGFSAPPCSVSFRDYAAASLPFHNLVQTNIIDGSGILASLRSIGDLDNVQDIEMFSNTQRDVRTSGCVICEQNLINTVYALSRPLSVYQANDDSLLPCNHMFCGNCVRELMMTGDKLNLCSACGTQLMKTIRFPNSMELSRSSENGERATGLEKVSPSMAELPTSDASMSTPADTINIHGDKTPDTICTTLHEAVRSGSADVVLDLLDGGHNPNGVEESATTLTISNRLDKPMHIAARLGRCDVVAPLVEYGADLDMPSGPYAYLPIHEATAYGQNAFLLLLLMLEKSTNSVTGDKDHCQRLTPTLVAAKHGRLKTLKLLLQKQRSEHEAVINSMICGSPTEHSGIENRANSTLDIPTCQLRSPLHMAAVHGHDHIVSYLLDSDGHVDNRVVPGGITPLLSAAAHGQFTVVKQLVEANADVENEWMGYTPLALLLNHHVWPKNRALETFEALLKAGAASGTLSPYGVSAMHIAARTGDLDILKLFFGNGVDVNIMSTEARPVSPLSMAFAHGQLQCCSLLLRKEAIFHASTCDLLLQFVQCKGSRNKNSPHPIDNLVFDERWKSLQWRSQVLEGFTSLLVKHMTNIEDVPLFICALAHLKQYDLIDVIRSGYISEDTKHTTTRALLEFTNHDLVYQLSLQGSNAIVVEELLTNWRAKPDMQKSAHSSSQPLSTAVAEAALRSDYDMLNAILSTVDTNVAAREAVLLDGKLSLSNPQHLELRSYVRSRYCSGR